MVTRRRPKTLSGGGWELDRACKLWRRAHNMSWLVKFSQPPFRHPLILFFALTLCWLAALFWHDTCKTKGICIGNPPQFSILLRMSWPGDSFENTSASPCRTLNRPSVWKVGSNCGKSDGMSSSDSSSCCPPWAHALWHCSQPTEEPEHWMVTENWTQL